MCVLSAQAPLRNQLVWAAPAAVAVALFARSELVRAQAFERVENQSKTIAYCALAAAADELVRTIVE